MSNFADVLKLEIARLVRKELKGEVAALRKTVTGHRGEIAALKRGVKTLMLENKRLAKSLTPANSRADASKAEVVTNDGRRAKYSADGLLATRQKLGLTQAQIAQILGVSPLSISKWESGNVTPRKSQQDKVVSLRKVGKREVAKLLAAS